MKVVHVVYSLNIGGLERVLINCVNKLPKEMEHHIICLTSFSEDFANLLPSNATLYSLNKKAGKDFSVYRKFFRLLKRISPNILHTYNLATNELQLFGWIARVPVRIHAEHGRDIYDPEGKIFKYKLLRKCMAFFTSKVIAVSGELFKWLKNDVRLPKTKVFLVRNGIDTNFFIPKDNEHNEFVIGHVGRLSPIKNQSLLLDAYALACDINKTFAEETKVIIVGSGESEERLIELSKRNGTQHQISFEGAQIDVLKYYQSFDCYVMTSLAEGIPMTLLEAMSCGVAAAVTNVGGMPEVVNEDVGILLLNGDTQDVASKLITLWQNKAATKEMGQKARQRIQAMFSEQAMVNKYQQLYGISNVRD